jgi:hypothetical protein
MYRRAAPWVAWGSEAVKPLVDQFFGGQVIYFFSDSGDKKCQGTVVPWHPALPRSTFKGGTDINLIKINLILKSDIYSSNRNPSIIQASSESVRQLASLKGLGVHYKIHDEMANISQRISLRTIVQMEITNEWGCADLHATRPGKYTQTV